MPTITYFALSGLQYASPYPALTEERGKGVSVSELSLYITIAPRVKSVAVNPVREKEIL